MIKDHSRHRMTESRLLIRNRAIRRFRVISGIQTYIDYLHENLLFFAPEGRINFGQGDVAGLTQVVNNYAAMLKIPQVTPSPVSPYDADADAWFEAVRLANIAAGASASLAAISTPNKVVNPGGGSGCTFPTSLHRWNCWERMLVHDNTTYS